MKFKTPRTSNTGKRFAKIEKRVTEAKKVSDDYIESIGLTQYRPNNWCVQSGISSIIYPEDYEVPDYMKKVGRRSYSPKLNTAEGKKIMEQWQQLPVVTWLELNMCVGIRDNSSCIGFLATNKDFYLFEVNEDIDFVPPKECEEITIREYRELSK